MSSRSAHANGAMKVCHFTTVHGAFDDRIFHKECRSLAEAGYQVSLIAPHAADELVHGVQIRALPRAGGRAQRILLSTARAFSLALREKADIYHFHDPELLPVGLLLKLATGKKVVYDVHEDYEKQILSKQYLGKTARKVFSVSIRTAERLISTALDAIVTATDDIRNNFGRHAIARSIKNYPVLSYFREMTAKPQVEKPFNVVYAGGLYESRGITETVKALASVPAPVRLTLYGEFESEEYAASVMALPSYQGCVEYRGRVEHREIAEVLGTYDAGVVCLRPLINYRTALPVKLFEYMAAGIPVIASDFPLWKEIVEGNRCGVCVDPLDPEAIAAAIVYLRDHPAIRDEMGANARNAVRERYNWDNEMRKLLTIYREVYQC